MNDQHSDHRPAPARHRNGRPAPTTHVRPQSRRPGRQRRPADPNALDLARDAFTALVTGPRPLALDGRGFPGLPDRRLPLSQVRTLLLARTCPQETRDAVWRDLLTRSRRAGGAWTVGCVGVALPALTTITAQLTDRFVDDPADIATAVLTGFLDALASADLDRPRVMLRLRWAAYRAGHAALSEALQAPPPVVSGVGSLLPQPPWGHPDLVLARAVTDAAITRLEADLIGATRLEETAVADWAAAHGMGTWAVYKLRKRAEHRLVVYLLDTDTGPDDGVSRSEADAGLVGGSSAGSPARRGRAGMAPQDASGVLSKTSAGAGVQLRRQVLPAHRVPEDPRCA
jgi:hypothetical protein